MHELIGDITLCILFAWVLGLLAHFSRQPLILAYLIAGFFIGPFGMGWVKSQESINVISELGLIFMLFMIGLEIDLKKIVRAGKVILFAAGGQLIGGVLLGILFFIGIGLSMGSGHFDALYLCIACALSSTVIIVKVLYEKRELDTLPGRITLGVLVLQDIFAILFLAVQPSLDNLQVSVILLSVARVGVLVATALVLSRCYDVLARNRLGAALFGLFFASEAIICRSRSGDAEPSCSCRNRVGSILDGAVIAWFSCRAVEGLQEDHAVAASTSEARSRSGISRASYPDAATATSSSEIAGSPSSAPR